MSKAKLSILVLLILIIPVLIKLGFWQLERADEKKLLLQQLEENSNRSVLLPQQLAGLSQADLAYRKIQLTGYFNNRFSYLLDNKIQNGKVGYEVLTLFEVPGKQSFLVNRGWIQGNAERKMPEIPEANNQVTIVSSIYIPEKQNLVLKEQSLETFWPQVIQTVNMDKIKLQIEPKTATSLYRHELRIDAEYNGALSVYWPKIGVDTHKHLGYAVQWFVMALVLLVYGGYMIIKRP